MQKKRTDVAKTRQRQGRDHAFIRGLMAQARPTRHPSVNTYVVNEAQGANNTGMIIGLASVAILGLGIVVVVYLLSRKSDGSTTISQLGGPPVPTHTLREIVREIPYQQDNRKTELVMAKREIQQSHMQTMQLPVLGVSPSITLYTAGVDMPGSVTVRVVGPPGSYGVFAYDPAVLDGFGPTALSAVPAGYSSIIPAAGTEVLRLKPGQGLYGISNVSGVYVSIMAAPMVSAIV